VPFEQLVVDGGCHSVTALYGSGGGGGGVRAEWASVDVRDGE
jgi:hypothetical protein